MRRDTDKNKNFTVTLQDIDDTIFLHLEDLQITVEDEGNVIKVPIIYTSPEKWVSARRDGFFRDRYGKIQLPVIVASRRNSENDDNMEMFNRHLKYPIMQRYSPKNKYTQFSALVPQNAPVHEVYYITMADHQLITYQFIVWAEYHTQMNAILEKFKFANKSYWGREHGLRFRCRVEGMDHQNDLDESEDKTIKTEFSVVCNGYILPETYTQLDRQYPSTNKLFTPKKILFGAETVSKGMDPHPPAPDSEGKIKSKAYPNLDPYQVPQGPPLMFQEGVEFTPIEPAAPIPVEVFPPVIPDAPINLVVTSGSAILSWNSASNNVASYSIWKSSDGVAYSNYTTIDGAFLTYTDTNVTGGNTYWYEVAAFNVVGTSSFSNTASIRFL